MTEAKSNNKNKDQLECSSGVDSIPIESKHGQSDTHGEGHFSELIGEKIKKKGLHMVNY